VDHFFHEAKGRLGGLHYLVNNAGIAQDGALWRMSDAAWRQVLDTNVTGAFNCIRSVAPTFRHQQYGKVVSVSAHQADRPGFGVANYAASKAALLGLTKAAAVELGPSNVNVNAVAPGFIRTERMAMLPPDVIDRAQKHSVLGASRAGGRREGDSFPGRMRPPEQGHSWWTAASPSNNRCTRYPSDLPPTRAVR
jgi:3-oxoacyl-[acyl-carrier protein] reductase